VRWKTQTYYGGNAVAVVPPQGATTTIQMLDARGKISELRQFKGREAGGAYDSTKYTYTADDQLESLTNADGSVWRYSYDLRGRQIKAEDPDKGTSTSTYDDADQPAMSSPVGSTTPWARGS
jgi:YD repeat-containing protein